MWGARSQVQLEEVGNPYKTHSNLAGLSKVLGEMGGFPVEGQCF